MNARTQRLSVAGPSGALECAVDAPAGAPRATGAGVPSASAAWRHDGQQGGADAGAGLHRAGLHRRALQLPRRRRFGRQLGARAGRDRRCAGGDRRAAPGRRNRWCWPGFPSAAMWPRTPLRAARRPNAWCWWARRSAASSCASVPADTLVIHGEHDDVVPLAAVFDWARPQALPVTVIPGAGHFFHGQLPLLKQLVIGACRALNRPQRCTFIDETIAGLHPGRGRGDVFLGPGAAAARGGRAPLHPARPEQPPGAGRARCRCAGRPGVADQADDGLPGVRRHPRQEAEPRADAAGIAARLGTNARAAAR